MTAIKVLLFLVLVPGLLIGWSLWSHSPPLLAPFMFFGVAHPFVTLYEELTFRKKFGAAYEAYLQRVPRWLPRMIIK